MEGRCAVDTWTELGFLRASNTPKVELVVGTHVVVCTGDEEVYVFNVQEKRFAVSPMVKKFSVCLFYFCKHVFCFAGSSPVSGRSG